MLGRIRHPNIVSLVGFCIHEENRFIVYELMENGSLDSQLHGIFFFKDFFNCIFLFAFVYCRPVIFNKLEIREASM